MPSSSKMAYTWAGDLSANRSLSSVASSAACSAPDSAAGCGARGAGGAFSRPPGITLAVQRRA